MIREIKNSTPAKNVPEIFLPGEIELRRRQKCLKEGIPLASAIVEDLRREGKEWQIPFPRTENA
jgi:LDH2 family malate/lactate/ureidoglycolate dehydrogenase